MAVEAPEESAQGQLGLDPAGLLLLADEAVLAVHAGEDPLSRMVAEVVLSQAARAAEASPTQGTGLGLLAEVGAEHVRDQGLLPGEALATFLAVVRGHVPQLPLGSPLLVFTLGAGLGVCLGNTETEGQGKLLAGMASKGEAPLPARHWEGQGRQGSLPPPLLALTAT